MELNVLGENVLGTLPLIDNRSNISSAEGTPTVNANVANFIDTLVTLILYPHVPLIEKWCFS